MSPCSSMQNADHVLAMAIPSARLLRSGIVLKKLCMYHQNFQITW